MEKIVIIGANHAGLEVARNLLESDKKFNITMIDKGNDISYLGCGVPMLLSNRKREYNEFFYVSNDELNQDISALYTNATVEKIDFVHKKVIMRDQNKKSKKIAYDKLVLATGASQVSLGVKGSELKGIHLIKTLREGLAVDQELADPEIKKVAIIGGGYIGVELAEAVNVRGKEVMVFDSKEHLMTSHYDPEFGMKIEERLQKNGVKLHLGEEVISYQGNSEGRVENIVTTLGTHKADLVILTMGFLPNTSLGRFHLDLYTNGAYIVDKYQRTTDPNVYAVGDCSTSYSNVLNELVVNFSVADAIRGAYIAAQDIIGNEIVSTGMQVSNAVSVYGLNLFSTGITADGAERYGIEYKYVDYEDWLRPTFMEKNAKIKIRIVYDAKTRRIIGSQICSETDQSGVLYTLSLAIQKEVTIDELKVSGFFFYPCFNRPNNFLSDAARKAK